MGAGGASLGSKPPESSDAVQGWIGQHEPAIIIGPCGKWLEGVLAFSRFGKDGAIRDRSARGVTQGPHDTSARGLDGQLHPRPFHGIHVEGPRSASSDALAAVLEPVAARRHMVDARSALFIGDRLPAQGLSENGDALHRPAGGGIDGSGGDLAG